MVAAEVSAKHRDLQQVGGEGSLPLPRLCAVGVDPIECGYFGGREDACRRGHLVKVIWHDVYGLSL